MALEFYVEQADRSPHSGVVNEDIYAGELVHDDGDGVDVLTYAATDEDAGGHIGLARYDGQAFARDHDDEVREDKYVAGDPQRERAQYQPFEDSAVVRIRTINETTDGVTTAPDINHKDVVGVVDETEANAPTSPGRVVQEGYSNNEDDDADSTTYNRSNNNFKAVGVAYRPDQNPAPVAGQQAESFDYPVRVVLFSDLKESA